jgi:hypothetical protein
MIKRLNVAGMISQVFIVLLIVTLAACTVTPAGNARLNSSHFVYPNSNVAPLSPVTASTSKLCGILGIFNWDGYTPETTEEVYVQALKKSGGDLLINTSESRSTAGYLYTVIFPPLISVCTTEVRGTAAKMQVGMQELK